MTPGARPPLALQCTPSRVRADARPHATWAPVAPRLADVSDGLTPHTERGSRPHWCRWPRMRSWRSRSRWDPEPQDPWGRFTRRPSPGAHGPKVAHRWADGSSDPRRSNHDARGMLYM